MCAYVCKVGFLQCDGSSHHVISWLCTTVDGSAGVMYTSFLGLIITELINYGEEKSK